MDHINQNMSVYLQLTNISLRNNVSRRVTAQIAGAHFNRNTAGSLIANERVSAILIFDGIWIAFTAIFKITVLH